MKPQKKKPSGLKIGTKQPFWGTLFRPPRTKQENCKGNEQRVEKFYTKERVSFKSNSNDVGLP